jgi:hypothetical protein
MMAREVRLDPRSRDSGRLGCAALVLAVALMVSGPISPRFWPEARVTSGALGVFALILHQLWQASRYRCPSCGERLKERICVRGEAPGDGNDSGPLHYACPRCDVEWDTGREWSTRGD